MLYVVASLRVMIGQVGSGDPYNINKQSWLELYTIKGVFRIYRQSSVRACYIVDNIQSVPLVEI